MVILFFIGAFIVQMRREQRDFYTSIVEYLGEETTNMDVLPLSKDNKNWDQKYGEELDAIIKRTRQESGLTDV